MASRQGNGRRIGGVINDLRPPRESVDLRRLWFGRTVYGGAYRSPRAAPHASRYLARVKAGETVEVTERGQLVALLAFPRAPKPRTPARY